jgi:hypothetical protein
MRYLILAFSFLSTASSAMNIERSEFIGSNSDGSRIAVFRSHFGASSDAPFASIQVIEAGKETPIFIKGLSALSGDEETVRQMKEQLVSATADDLNAFDISSRNDHQVVDALTSQFSNQILIELDVRRADRELQRYNVRFDAENSVRCSSGVELRATLSTLNDRAKNIDLNPTYPGCWDRQWRFSKAITAGSYVWLFLYVVTEPMPDLFHAGQRILGIAR